MPSIRGLATNSALTSVEDKIPNINSLVKKKKTDYDTKISEIETNSLIIIMIKMLLLPNLII